MNILLKQRLIGAIVLISLAVIFIPMLFTNQGDKEEQKFESSIPPEPAYEIKSPQISVPLSLPPKSLEKVPLSEPQAADEPEDSQDLDLQDQQTPASANPTASQTQKPSQTAALQNTAPQNTPAKPAEVVKNTASKTTDSVKATVEKPAAAPVKPQAGTTSETHQVKTQAAQTHATQTQATQTQATKTTDTAVKTPEAPIKEQTVSVTERTNAVTGWVVQVGSFSQKANAEKLRDRLRKMGMASFVATAQSKGKTIYRVRVGPEIDRADAEKIHAAIKAKTKLNGLVMKYP